MTPPFFAGAVDAHGQLVLDDFAAYARHLARYKGRRVRVTVRRASGVRTLDQNARLWALYGAIAEWSGHSTDEVHEAMKLKFLAMRVLETPRGPLGAPPSTRVLSIEAFANYMTAVEAWAVEAGVDMPEWTRTG